MGLFDRFKKAPQQTTNHSLNIVYELLFCDNLALYQLHNQQPHAHPWDILLSENSTTSEFQNIIDDSTQESRVKVLAYNKLRSTGQPVNRKELLGVIVEVGMDEGLDVLASYKDGTARFISHSGKMIIWETADATSEQLTKDLFAEGTKIINQIGPWDKARRPQPARGMARISFLVSDGLYFGEAPINTLFADPLAAAALMHATSLMQYLTEKAVTKVS